MKRRRSFINIEKEERWLSGMAAKGYAFTRRSALYSYYFVQAPPEEAVYKIDYHTFGSREQLADYVALFEDSGWKHIYGTVGSGYQYFLKTSDASRMDIFSDNDSRAMRYKAWADSCLSAAISCFILIFTLFPVGIKPPLMPSSWYQTPGLWLQSGWDFWRAFLFETPFALLRIVSCIVLYGIPIFSALYAIYGYRKAYEYRNKSKAEKL